MRGRTRAWWGAAATVVLAVGVAGCSTTAPAPTHSATTRPPSPSATASPTPTAPPTPTLAPRLSADENLPFFDYVNEGVIAANAGAHGRDFIDALVAAGFDKADMQVTVDTTSAGEVADSVQWSVLWQGECMIGQYGPNSGGYHSMVAAPAGAGTCLLGGTRPIDW